FRRVLFRAHFLHRIEGYCSSEPFYFSLKSRSYGRVQLVRYGNLFQAKVQLPDKTVIAPAPVTITEILIAMSAIIFRRKGFVKISMIVDVAIDMLEIRITGIKISHY